MFAWVETPNCAKFRATDKPDAGKFIREPHGQIPNTLAPSYPDTGVGV